VDAGGPAPPDAPNLVDVCRGGVRLVLFAALVLVAAAEWVLLPAITGLPRSARARAAWLQRTCRRLVRLLSIRADYTGAPATGGLLVCNHLSYLDILVLAARHPLAFVAKKDVRTWPVIGWLTECGGTLFVDREQRGDVVRIATKLSGVIASGTVVCVFAEGTSSDGTDVLPFRPSLLQPAITGGWVVTPAWIGYSLEHGSVADEVAYWRDMSFLPHLLKLFTKERIGASVRYGTGRRPNADRKTLAARLRTEVRRLGGLDPEFALSQAA
jgi:1-acyl-sn-glycerol-3-phosphate acyltransferase